MRTEILLRQLNDTYEHFKLKGEDYQKLKTAINNWNKECSGKGSLHKSGAWFIKTMFLFLAIVIVPSITTCYLFIRYIKQVQLDFIIKIQYSCVVMMLALVYAIIYMALRSILYKKARTKLIMEKEKIIWDCVNPLYDWYEKFYLKYGYNCPMQSFQFCDPIEVDQIRNVIFNGLADNIPTARMTLNGSLFDYSQLKVRNPIHTNYNTRNQGQPDTQNTNRWEESSNQESKKEYKEGPTQHTDKTYRSTMFFEGCRNLEEVKKRYRELAKKFHIDNGGNSAKMTALNIEYSEQKEYYK